MSSVTQPRNLFANIVQWGCFLVLLGGIIVVALVGLWLFATTPSPPPGPHPTAIVWTATPTPTPTNTPTPTPTALPVTPRPPTDIAIGEEVEVTGTGSAGLSLRAGVGLDADRLGVALEGETFLVISGPVEADDLTWWRIRSTTDPNREGWAAANYLRQRQGE